MIRIDDIERLITHEQGELNNLFIILAELNQGEAVSISARHAPPVKVCSTEALVGLVKNAIDDKKAKLEKLNQARYEAQKAANIILGAKEE